MDTIAHHGVESDLDLGTRSVGVTRTSRTPKLDRAYCQALIRGRSTCESVAAPFRGQLRALLVECARLQHDNAQLLADNGRLLRDNHRLVLAADALHEHVKRCAHSTRCVCPLCRGLRGYMEIVKERVEAYRARSGS